MNPEEQHVEKMGLFGNSSPFDQDVGKFVVICSVLRMYGLNFCVTFAVESVVFMIVMIDGKFYVSRLSSSSCSCVCVLNNDSTWKTITTADEKKNK